MNAVEIKSAVPGLAHQPFNKGEFPFAFLAAFGNKETTLKRLRKGDSRDAPVTYYSFSDRFRCYLAL